MDEEQQTDAAPAEIRKGKRGRMTPEQRQELFEIGPDAYGEKHGYASRGRSMLKAIYNGRAPARKRAGVSRKTAGNGRKPEIQSPPPGPYRQMHPAIEALLSLLPPAETPMSDQRLSQFEAYFSATLRMLYPPEKADCNR